MVIKKPYAFLIKNFRLMHIILSALLLYVSSKSMAIYRYFNDFVKTGYYNYYNDLTNKFINYYMFIGVILIILFGVLIHWLLKWKDKRRAFYVYLCMFYITLFLVFIYIFNLLQTIQTVNVDIRTIRVTRDIVMIFGYAQYFFVGFSIFRGIGFDIKKFNFGKDIEDLNIEVQDNEEVEVILAKDSYKYMRTLRKIIREIKYFALENQFLFIIIVTVSFLGIGLGIYLNFKVYNKMYQEDERFLLGSLSLSVENSYVSYTDYTGAPILDGKKYFVVEINVENRGNISKKLEVQNFRLAVGDDVYFPVLSLANYFIDLGQVYTNEEIFIADNKNYLFVYELPEDESGSYSLKVFNDVRVLAGEIDTDYKKTLLRPIDITKTVDEGEFFLEEEVKFDKSRLKETSVKINSYKIASSFEEKYNYCSNNTCYDGLYIVKPDTIGKKEKTILRLDTSYMYDKSTYVAIYITSSTDFMKYFANISYEINGVKKIGKPTIIDVPYINKNIVFMEMTKDLEKAENLRLIITIRNTKYEIPLRK